MIPITTLSPIASIIGFIIGLPTTIATYYEAFKTRKDAELAREGLLHSRNCLEFLVEDGECINVVPLETLHTMPKPGDIVFLPGDGVRGQGKYHTGAYRIEKIEHIYTEAEHETKRPGEARLAKVVAMVTWLH